MTLDAMRGSEIQTIDFPCLYDVSWTLHRLQWPNLSNKPHSLLSSSRSRTNRARQLQDYLHVDITGPEADNTFDEKAGAIKKCTWDLLDAKDRVDDAILLDADGRRIYEEQGSGLVITLSYDVHDYVAVLYGPTKASGTTNASERPPQSLPLLLSKTPTALTRRLFTFLFDTFDIRISPLNPSPGFLSDTLETYVGILGQGSAPLSVLGKDQFVNGILKDLKVALSFNAPVAPHLRTIEVDIPGDTICNVLAASHATKKSFLHVLAAHLENHTGMQLPLAARDNPPITESEQVLRISKVACHAFALTEVGRFKIVEQARNAARVHNLAHVVQEANEMILSSLLTESMRVPD